MEFTKDEKYRNTKDPEEILIFDRRILNNFKYNFAFIGYSVKRPEVRYITYFFEKEAIENLIEDSETWELIYG